EELSLLNATLTLTNTKAEILEALGELEASAAALYGTQGVVHLPRNLAYFALGYGALEKRSGRLFTLLDTPAVAGSGYDNEGTKAYWSPQMVAYSSEEFTSSSRAGDLFDRS